MSELLVNILEKYKARSGDEQDFMDKHTDEVEVTNAPGREGSSEGEKRKKHDRKKTRQGRDEGEDEDVYEEYILSIIDEAIDELIDELDEEESVALQEMISDDQQYEDFVESVFADNDLELFLEEDEKEEDDDEEEDDDDEEEEDGKDAKVDVNPKEKNKKDDVSESKVDAKKVEAFIKKHLGTARYNKVKGDVRTMENKKGDLVISDRGQVLKTVPKGEWEDDFPLKEDVELEEGFSKWSVELPSFKKTIEVDKARSKAEAIKKAVAKAGGKPDDWKHTKIGKVKKLSEEVLEEGDSTFTWKKVNSVLQHKGYNPKRIADLSVKLKGKLNGGKVKWTDLNDALSDSNVSPSNIGKLLTALKQ